MAFLGASHTAHRTQCPPALEADLVQIVGRTWVRTAPGDLLAYSYDATGERFLPDVVVLPASTSEVAECVRLARLHRFSVVPRGAATNLSGGTLPVAGGMVMSMTRMNRIVRVDPDSRLAVVEAGATNQSVQDAAATHGFFFAPDPSSMKAATIGGCVAENAGGPRCAKYGVTLNHVLGLTLVLSDGSVLELGGEVEDAAGLDLVSLVVGSEGTLGVITQAVLRLTPLPAGYRTLMGVFDSVAATVAAASAIVAARILPAALEMLDRSTLEMINRSRGGSFPEDAEALLLAELDGDPDELGPQAARVEQAMRDHGASEVVVARGATERESLWAARRSGFGALALSSPSLVSMDVTVPRDRLVPMIDQVIRLASEHRLKVFLVAHAGDGNMHPTVPFDPRDPDERRRLRLLIEAVSRAAVLLGGSISGEHGIGIEKLAQMEIQYSPEQRELMERVRRAFDPSLRMNPGKNVVSPSGAW